MDFWNSYKTRAVGDFAVAPLTLRTAVRRNASLNAVAGFSRELEINKAFLQRYDEAHRYIIAKEITHDLLLSAYDVNSGSILAARMTLRLGKQEWSGIFSRLRRIGLPNLEFRIIGLQNGGSVSTLEGMEQLHKRTHGALAEVDLFGSAVRNIVIDTKTGVPYDLLLLNRIYRAGELTNTVTVEDFGSKLSQLSFA
jgi:hypothetical protein